MNKTGLKIAWISIVVFAVVCAFGMFFFNSIPSAQATIVNTSYIEDSQGVRTYYKDEIKAIKDAQVNKDSQESKTLVLTSDWTLRVKTEIGEGKKVTIDMNGHSMTITARMRSAVLFVLKNAELNLTSTAEPHQFTYNGPNSDGTASEHEVWAGGLLTGGHNGDPGGGIAVLDNASCTIDNVAVAGNTAYSGGGVALCNNCNLYMKNGATIQFNRCADGGGGVVAGEDSHIYMDNSSIDNNAGDKGGGVYSNFDGIRIQMKNNSSISNNKKIKDGQGGGVYFANSYCSISSSDKTAVIKDNDGKEGGGVTFKGSYGGCFGVTLQKNEADENGGAILNQGKENVIEDCTITDNICGGGNEGGGIFNSAYRDITLKGKIIIKDNTRGVDGSPDDLFLNGNWFFNSYILGGVDQGSSVGIRTESTGTRMIGKQITTYHDGTYFMDLSNSYYVTHGNDHGGDLWQRKL